MSNFSNIF